MGDPDLFLRSHQSGSLYLIGSSKRFCNVTNIQQKIGIRNTREEKGKKSAVNV